MDQEEPLEESKKDLTNARIKRKWQIAFRRYIMEQKGSTFYAPFFGLDISKLRKWIELQFLPGMGWEGFGKTWQFDHVLPLSCFNLQDPTELKLCWNFSNIRIVPTRKKADGHNLLEILSAKAYFYSLYLRSSYHICKKMLEKIQHLEDTHKVGVEGKTNFLLENQGYLNSVTAFGSFEFELLNEGKDLDEIAREMEFLKKFEN